MANNVITEDERNQFRSIAFKKKADSMELYLIGRNGYKYNMQEVGEAVFGDANYSFTVSLIHRCYNFSGQNGGKYRNGCKFEQKYGYRVTRSDIEAFLKKYPNGTFNNGVTFEDFLLTRLKSAQNSVPAAAPAQRQPAPAKIPQQPRQVSQPQPIPQPQPVPQPAPQPAPRYSYQEPDSSDSEARKQSATGCLVIVMVIMLAMFFAGVLFKHWIIALILAIFAISSIYDIIKS